MGRAMESVDVYSHAWAVEGKGAQTTSKQARAWKLSRTERVEGCLRYLKKRRLVAMNTNEQRSRPTGDAHWEGQLKLNWQC